ncbi:MAG: glycosyl hydrolase family 95 catalytic domain-containing protein [Christensenellales bacterium]
MFIARQRFHNERRGNYPNLFCAHPPFQIDGNFGAASGILKCRRRCCMAKSSSCPPCPGLGRTEK